MLLFDMLEMKLKQIIKKRVDKTNKQKTLILRYMNWLVVYELMTFCVAGQDSWDTWK